MPLFGKSKFDARGKFCYITGGSQGLGRALAMSLVKQGADVVVVARDLKKLADTEQELKSLARPGQKISSISADLMDVEKSEDALAQAVRQLGGRTPDYVFLCAGTSRPKLFLDSSPDELQSGLNNTYWVSAWTAHAASKLMASQRVTGSIIFVSSFLGYTSFAGYTSYAPGKYALRGLADTLRQEMLMHDINVHIYMPTGISGPGYDAENVNKPKITKKIEEGDSLLTPEACADILLDGVGKGYYQITNDFVSDLVRLQSRGSAPSNNVLLDTIYWFIGGIGVPIWRMITDYQVRGAKKEVKEELTASGFYTK
ncbi:hypothetical protein P7C73_g59, partial [Tremellales sp. Uapishka_1]